MRTLTLTEQQLIALFDSWGQRQKADPASFLTHEEIEKRPDGAELCSTYTIWLANELFPGSVVPELVPPAIVDETSLSEG